MAETVPIPEPSGLPILGNVRDIDPEFPLGSMVSISEKFGEIVRLRFPGRNVVLVSTHALVNECCDEKRFNKAVKAALEQVREGVHDGLFTAREHEENWGIAHRVLMPAFGPMSIRGMFGEMHDIATQLALKWARYGANTPISVTDDFTRLTLDTLALCSMGFRFNSFYSPQLHPFIESMGDFLTESGNRARRVKLPSVFYKSKDEKFQKDINIMRTTAKEVLEARKSETDDTNKRKDLLNAMLEGVDSKTKKHMTDDSIMDNLITFLIAGHETTSGLLSFAFYQLLKHPEAYRKAQQEVDDVVGKGPIKVEHLAKLPYINAVLREVLRVNATIPLFLLEAKEDTLLGGKYPVEKGQVIVNLLARSHLDPEVYGEDAAEFKPERMLDEPFEKRNKEFPNCWKPFGNGVRACIGRAFAWQEALLVMAMLLQNFNFVLDPNYVFGYKQTLTIKPKDMQMRAILRDGLTPTSLEHRLAGLATPEPKTNGASHKANSVASSSAPGVPLTVLYGSNSGTCESLAQRVASDAAAHGFNAKIVDCLDSANGSLPTDHPVIIITASYEGQPPDNAGHFVAWLEGLQKEGKKSLEGVSYAVYGCGNKDWASTFHRIPKLVDTALENAGATRLAEIGLSDVSNGDVFTEFESWEDESLWSALEERYQTEGAGAADLKVSGIDVAVSNPRTSALRQDVTEALLVDSRRLTGPSEEHEAKKHIEVELPEEMTYKAGDYLAVLPMNPPQSVTRVLRYFQLSRDAHLNISATGATSLPLNNSIPAFEIFSSYVELSQPATKRGLLTLASYADEPTKEALHKLANDTYAEEISSKRTSVLDLLERFPAIALPLGAFLSLMPPMRVRQYSISSSPLANPRRATLTFSVLDAPSLSGTGHRHMGVASTYLDSLAAGDRLHVAVRTPKVAFQLPSNSVPIICIAAGSGLAPFRGFIQERAAMIEAGRKDLAPALLFFGCRSPDLDDLYREEMDEWERAGAVSIRRAFSRASDKSEGCKYVQDRLWHDREDVLDLWGKGAKVYVCGSRKIVDESREVSVKLAMNLHKENGEEKMNEEEAREWLASMRNLRFVMDVFD